MKVHWTGTAAPTPDDVEVDLCELYHCRPSELDEEDWVRVRRHLAVLDVRRRAAGRART